ncbi:DUF4883 family protein [Hathewaya histolytica]|uniref:DUF4883 family protein n=1 Tax=Hathewaya histolytica TaxID=1498 RepID=UPI003B67C8BE
MKKYKSLLILILCFSLFLSGCYIKIDTSKFKKKKPSKSYYTNEMLNCFKAEDPTEINVLYLNFYKGKRLEEGEILTTRKFFKYLKSENYIYKPKDLPQNPEYKIFITFSERKFVIDVYNENYISLYPWDGDYEKDYISMKDTYTSYNLFNLCKYIVPNTK